MMRPLQVQSFVSCVMGDVEALPSVAGPSVEELRMQYPGIGCWAPTCVPLLKPLNTSQSSKPVVSVPSMQSTQPYPLP